MSQADKDKWEARYRAGAYADRTHPSALVNEWLPKLEADTPHRRALDLACGAGRNVIQRVCVPSRRLATAARSPLRADGCSAGPAVNR